MVACCFTQLKCGMVSINKKNIFHKNILVTKNYFHEKNYFYYKCLFLLRKIEKKTLEA